MTVEDEATLRHAANGFVPAKAPDGTTSNAGRHLRLVPEVKKLPSVPPAARKPKAARSSKSAAPAPPSQIPSQVQELDGDSDANEGGGA